MVPGSRNSSHGARAIGGAALSRAPRGPGDISSRQPAASATSRGRVARAGVGNENFRTHPATAPGTSAASVGNSVRSLSCVAITTLSIGTIPSKRAL